MTETTTRALAIGYVRVSTDEQHLGPEAQRAAMLAWAGAHGAELVAVHEDLGVSGAAPIDARPGLLAALAALREHRATVLLVAKRDRLARDVIAAAMIERLAGKAGARVLSAAGEGTDAAEGDPTGLLMRRLIDAFAEYERAVIGARTKAALGVKRARGERVGGVPYGYRLGADGVALVTEPDEQAVIAEARRLRAAGLSLRGVAGELDRRGFRSRTGRAFDAQQVRRMVA